ncbi:MAG: hypothetical protein M0D55_19955 [Elusimicrobiota bacterium]|nr:MAG: hypothetical protein M0D55_19955 [Elusimicrobiota bacterium]
MKKPFAFAAVLARVRRERGYPNPHSFYKGCGGRRAFDLSFVNYLALEKGRSLPKPRRLEAIVGALGLPESSPLRRELVRSYLVSLLGTDALLRILEAPPAPAGESASDEASRQAQRQRAATMDLMQWRVLATDPDAYRVHVFLVNTPEWSSDAEIAAAVGLPAAKARSVLKKLAAARIVEAGGGRARSPFAYKFLQTLPLTPATSSLKAPILKTREGFAGPDAKLLKRVNVTTRFAAANLERYFQRLQDAVWLSGVYGDAEKTPDSDVCFVDARIFKVFD